MRPYDPRKSLPALCAIVLLSANLLACGGATAPTGSGSSRSSSSAAVSSPPSTGTTPVSQSSQSESNPPVYHIADAADRRQIAALVRRYYKTAVAENGAQACSMLYSTFAEAVPQDYGRPPGPPYYRGTTCPAVMTKVFEHFHEHLAVRLPRLKVAQVRVREHQGFAVLSFRGLPEREIHVTREVHTWKIATLIDSEL